MALIPLTHVISRSIHPRCRICRPPAAVARLGLARSLRIDAARYGRGQVPQGDDSDPTKLSSWRGAKAGRLKVAQQWRFTCKFRFVFFSFLAVLTNREC